MLLKYHMFYGKYTVHLFAIKLWKFSQKMFYKMTIMTDLTNKSQFVSVDNLSMNNNLPRA